MSVLWRKPDLERFAIDVRFWRKADVAERPILTQADIQPSILVRDAGAPAVTKHI
jgi:hypothetical protein